MLNEIKTLVELKDHINNSDNLTQSGLAKYCGVSRESVRKWLNGSSKINDDRLKLIEDYTNANLSKLSPTKIVKKVVEDKYNKIREDLIDQLENKNKFGRQYEDIVDHAVYLFKLKDQLQEDIIDRGIRITLPTGNGYEKTTPNESIKNLTMVSSQILRVLKELDLATPEDDGGGLNESDFM